MRTTEIEAAKVQACLTCQLPTCEGEESPRCGLKNAIRAARAKCWREEKQRRQTARKEQRGYHPEIHGQV